MSIARSQLTRGPAVVSYNSTNYWTRDDIEVQIAPAWRPVLTSMFGEIDKTKHDLVMRIGLKLWGAWENLSTLFPTAYLNPAVGASVFGNSDITLAIQARNGDLFTFTNAALTKMSDLYLGVDSDLFSADVEFTALIGNSNYPETAAAYYTYSAGSYAGDATYGFSKTNFKKTRVTGAWGTNTGFTAIVPKDGFKVSWGLDLRPITVDGYGTVDMTLAGLIATARCIPIGPTPANKETYETAVNQAHGVLLSTGSADLTIDGTGISVVLKNANMIEDRYNFGLEKLRNGEMAWSTTRGFSAGAPTAVSTVA